MNFANVVATIFVMIGIIATAMLMSSGYKLMTPHSSRLVDGVSELVTGSTSIIDTLGLKSGDKDYEYRIGQSKIIEFTTKGTKRSCVVAQSVRGVAIYCD